MNKLLKVLLVAVGLVSFSANAVVVTPKILVHAPAKTSNVSPDKWFTSCKYIQSDTLPEGFGCDVNGNIISISDFAKSEHLNTSNLRAYTHKKLFTGEMRVIIEEVR